MDVPEVRSVDRDSPDLAWWRDALATRGERLAWWRAARFGMFIHWGVYSGLGGVWRGEPVSGYAEHIQRIRRIPIPVYRQEVAAAFNPVRFDADAWAALARAAGMGYLVITAKHHDGFAMYDSAVSDYSIVRATPYGRDPMRELKAACARHGVRFGFYYSHAFDWGDAEAPGNDWDHDNPGGDRGLHGGPEWWTASPHLLPQARRYVDRKALPQLAELIRTYDPDILWFDTPHKLPPEENLRILRFVRRAKPAVLVNSRVCQPTGQGHYGDFVSTTDKPDAFPPPEHLPSPGDAWEAIPTTNESYGYHRLDRRHKPAAYFIRLLARAAARGGNLLLNIGPMGDGRFDPADVEILEGIAAWMARHGASIHGTARTPLPAQAWGESTRRGSTLYLHVQEWPAGGVLEVGGLRSGVRGARLLGAGAGGPALEAVRAGECDVRIRLPEAAPDAADSVVVLDGDGEVQADPARLLLPGRPNHLHVFDGELRGGARLRFGPGKAANAHVERWVDPGDSVAWPVRIAAPGAFAVEAHYDAPAGCGGRFAVDIGGAPLEGGVGEGRRRRDALGTVHLAPGRLEVRARALAITGTELMRLRAVSLVPADPAPGGD